MLHLPFVFCLFIFSAFMIIHKKIDLEIDIIFWCIFDTLAYAQW